jgi:hypothetical protein
MATGIYVLVKYDRTSQTEQNISAHTTKELAQAEMEKFADWRKNNPNVKYFIDELDLYDNE